MLSAAATSTSAPNPLAASSRPPTQAVQRRCEQVFGRAVAQLDGGSCLGAHLVRVRRACASAAQHRTGAQVVLEGRSQRVVLVPALPCGDHRDRPTRVERGGQASAHGAPRCAGIRQRPGPRCACSAAEMVEPFGEGSTSRGTGSQVSSPAGDRDGAGHAAAACGLESTHREHGVVLQRRTTPRGRPSRRTAAPASRVRRRSSPTSRSSARRRRRTRRRPSRRHRPGPSRSGRGGRAARRSRPRPHPSDRCGRRRSSRRSSAPAEPPAAAPRRSRPPRPGSR